MLAPELALFGRVLKKTHAKKMQKCFLVSIDIGRKNLAVCILECVQRKVVFWRNFDVNLKAYNPIVYRKQLEKIFLSLPKGHIYVVERQMFKATKNCFIECILHSMIAYRLNHLPVPVNPRAVANFFALRDGKYFKKKDAVFVCKQILKDEKNAAIKFGNESLRSAFLESKTTEKMDDLADCLLQALYHLETKVQKRQQFNPKAYEHYQGRVSKKRSRQEDSDNDDESTVYSLSSDEEKD